LQSAEAVRQWLDPAARHGATLLDQIINHQAQIIAYANVYVLLILLTLPPWLLLLMMPPSAESDGRRGSRMTRYEQSFFRVAVTVKRDRCSRSNWRSQTGRVPT
jgi:hypothetical protein